MQVVGFRKKIKAAYNKLAETAYSGILSINMNNILIISGHTNTTSDSVANKTILEQIETSLPGCRTVYLDRLYPDFAPVHRAAGLFPELHHL